MTNGIQNVPKTVIVTGGSRGIGRSVALKFAREGANITVNYNKNKPGVLAAEIERAGGRALLVQGDVALFSDAERIIKSTFEAFGRVDVLVNNAGITRDNLIIRMSEDDFDNVIATNLKGAFNMIRHAAGLMLKQKSGTIINISSVAGLGGNIGQANYAASKAGLIGLTKATARELASRGITCNAVAPGMIDTDMIQALPEETRGKMLAQVPLRRFGLTDEIADAVYFLANNKYITGETLCIDGGMMLL